MTEIKALALEFYYINVTDPNFKEGILYTVTVRTMAKMENGVTVLSSVVDDTRGSGIVTESIKRLSVKVENARACPEKLSPIIEFL